MTGPNHDEAPDPAEADGGAGGTGSHARPDDAGAADEVADLQDAAPGAGSQASLLRLLGWRPGDPLPDDLLDDGDALGVTGPVDGSPYGAAVDAPYDVGDGADLPGGSTAGPQGRDGMLGAVEAASDAGLLPQPGPEPVVPINWNTLDAALAEQEWWQLDAFVYWLRDDFGLTPQELPPMWHRHTELVWELSALRTAWLAAHAEDAHAGSPLMWLRDLGDSRRRLRDWVQRCGTTLTHDRPTRRTTWPGEDPATSPAEAAIADRATDFAVFVADDVARRRRIEAEAQAEIEQARAHRIQRLRQAWHLPTPHTDEPGAAGHESARHESAGHEPGTEEGTP
jgi:hypothetical protein